MISTRSARRLRKAIHAGTDTVTEFDRNSTLVSYEKVFSRGQRRSGYYAAFDHSVDRTLCPQTLWAYRYQYTDGRASIIIARL